MHYLIMVITAIYLTLIIHELGHCIFPRIFRYRKVNKIVLGIGNVLKEVDILYLNIEIRKWLLPVGRFGNKATNINLDELTFLQRTACHFGGVTFNLITACSLFVIYSNIDVWHLPTNIVEIFNIKMFFSSDFQTLLHYLAGNGNNYFHNLIHLLAIINAFVSVMNTLPLPVYVNKGKVVFSDGGQFIIFLLTYIKKSLQS